MASRSLGGSRRRDYLAARKDRQGGIRLKWDLGEGYEPVFPHVFRDEGLTYSPSSFDVFKTHYLEARYGPRPLMKLEHLGCYELLYYQSEMGERFYTVEMAKRLAISRHTLTGYFDVLENLLLIKRVRNGRSFNRYISVVMQAPLLANHLDAKHGAVGYRLYTRVSGGFVQKWRREVGPSRWPELTWDYETVCNMLKDSTTPQHLNEMRKAFRFAEQIMCVPGREYETWSRVDFKNHFEKLVRGECQREGWACTQRLFDTAWSIDMLGQSVN